MVESTRHLRKQGSPATPNPGFDLEDGNSESAKNLEDRLRYCMKLVGGGSALSQKTGIPRSTLETYLTGQAEPKVSRVLAIADAADVSVEWLSSGRGPVRLRGDVVYKAGSQAYGDLAGVAEEAPHAGLDHLDEGLLTAAVCAVDAYLEERGLALDSQRKAQLIGLLYDIVFDEEQADRERVLSKNVTRLFKLVS